MSEKSKYLSILSLEDNWLAQEDTYSENNDSSSEEDSSYSTDPSYEHDDDEDFIRSLSWNSDDDESFSVSGEDNLSMISEDEDLETILKPESLSKTRSPEQTKENACIELEFDGTDVDPKQTIVHCLEGNGKSISEESDSSAQSLSSTNKRIMVNQAQHCVTGHQKLKLPSSFDQNEQSLKDLTSTISESKTEEQSRYRHRAIEMYSDNLSNDSFGDDFSVDIIQKLYSHPLQNELEAMKSELNKTEKELLALENDHDFYDKKLDQLEMYSKHMNAWNEESALNNHSMNEENKSVIDCQWGDLSEAVSGSSLYERSFKEKAQSMLSGSMQKKNKFIRSMRKNRGICFDFDILDSQRDTKSTVTNFQSQSRKHSLAKTICNVSLTGQSSYFINWDNGKWCHHGPIAKNFLNRLERKSSKGKCPSVRFLSIGPEPTNGGNRNACYYAELSNNEYWWVNFDQDFHNAVQNLPVQRVAFGSPYPGSDGKPSWIVLGKDGRSIWKGIPAHLHKILSSRDSSLCAACEVSLGPSGSFFIKFLSGEIDYCLPAAIANKCEEIELRGGVVTNVLLHVDCNGYIIRHTELKTKDKN